MIAGISRHLTVHRISPAGSEKCDHANSLTSPRMHTDPRRKQTGHQGVLLVLYTGRVSMRRDETTSRRTGGWRRRRMFGELSGKAIFTRNGQRVHD